MKRRDFLRNMAIMPILGHSITSNNALANVKSAFAEKNKTLIVIFQRGGCDGLNVVVPYGEDEYYNLRPDIAIAAPNSSSDSALDLDGFFGLHPATKGLYDIFQEGNLAILPSVHYSNANRSHFSSQDYIESGMGNQRLADGWLNRYLLKTQKNSDLRSVSFNNLAHSLQGNMPVVTINNLSSLNDQFNHSQRNVLHKIFNQQLESTNRARSLVNKNGNLALKDILPLDAFSNSNYTVENGATYPDTSYGQQLKDIAHLIKAGVGLEVATVSNNNWDHHANQGGAQGTQATKLLEFSDGIAALYKDLGSEYMSDVTILTISEFGRTVKQNASMGTDHGNASSWFVIGEQVNGGLHGEWPGLMPDQLHEGRYLKHTIDFTNVYAELLSKHLDVGENLESILPGSQYQPIGFLT